MPDPFDDVAGDDLSAVMDGLSLRARDLELGANAFARAMTAAFARGVTDGQRFDDLLKALALRLSDLSLRMALQPVTRGLAGSLSNLFGNLFGGFGGGDDPGAVTPFAAGGVVAAPTYFALGRGLGLAGEAGAEAILPLARGADGRLGVAASGGGAGNVIINIATPDAASFRHSEVYVTGLVARAVARGQRGM